MAEQATPVLTQRPKTTLKIERRAWLRFPNEQDIICHPVTSGPQREPELAWLGKVRDVSPAGIGLSMSRRFDPGAELIAELSVKPAATLLLPVRVVHATPDKKGLWIIGCEFIFPLSEEELQTCLREKRADR
jgi:PilZ domain